MTIVKEFNDFSEAERYYLTMKKAYYDHKVRIVIVVGGKKNV